jgi:Predicted permeases
MSSEIIFIVLALFSPELLSIVFPISVFLAIGFVLTPIYKSRYAVLEASSFSVGKLLYGQKFLLLSIFSFSLFLSLWLSPYAKNEGQKLIDVDNNFAAKIAEPKGLVQIQKNKFNVFGTKSENGYEDLIFINSDDVEKFMYGRSGYVDQQNLVLEDGFLYDNENKAISRFNVANVPLRTSTDDNYKGIVELFRNINTENFSELFSR